MKWWVWSTTEEHFEFAFRENLWASSTPKVKKYVKKGDKILFYVSKHEGQLQGSFRGTCTVRGKWNRNDSPKWPQELRKKQSYVALAM